MEGKMGRKSEKISGGFPLKKHANGQWCAWLNGKRRYFGAGSQEEALENYCRRIRGIMDGTEDREKIQAGKLTVAQLVILFLESIQSKVRTNETSARRFHDIRRVLEVLVDVWGGDRLFSAVTQADCLRLRETFADGCKLDRLNTKIKMVNQMVRWAFDADHLDKMPKISKWLEAPTRKALARERDLTPHFFSPVQIWTLIDAAEKTIYPLQWRALLLMAVNCGFGSRDLSDLTFADLDLDRALVFLQRGKTGTARRAILWPETVRAVREYLEKERPETEFTERVFVTSEGTLWNYDAEKSRVDSLGLAFRRIAKKLGIAETSFYSFRRTFRTIADETGDIPAVNLIMGHTDYTMGGVYRQFIRDERLKAVSDHVWNWISKKSD